MEVRWRHPQRRLLLNFTFVFEICHSRAEAFDIPVNIQYLRQRRISLRLRTPNIECRNWWRETTADRWKSN